MIRSTIFLALVALLGLTGCAPVTVSSTPPGARVYYKDSDELIGTTPVRINLVANTKEVVVRKDGYFSKTVVLSPIDPESMKVELRRREKVLLLSKPEGAELYVEGVGRVGQTPYVLDYGKPYRTFEVRAPGYAAQLFTIPEDPEGNVVIDLDRGDTVTIVSTPKNAEIFASDGSRVGTTPLAVPASAKSVYELRKEGYYPRQFTVDEGTHSPLMVEMEREPIIIVLSDPEGAEVVHRGVVLGKTPFRQMVKEDTELELRADRFYPSTITLLPDSPRQVSVALKPKPFVTVRSNPGNASLYRSGGVELIGKTPVEILVEKDTALEMQLDGFATRPFMLSPQSSREVTVTMERASDREKTVVIDSEPSGALVYRPGGAELIGKTPLQQQVRGERTFELHLDGFKTKIVTVAPDSADNVVFALAKDESARNVTVSDPLLNTPSSF